MAKIKIITDSASDITREDVEKWDIGVVSFTINVDGEQFKAGVDLSPDEFYEKLKNCKEIPTTAQVTPNDLYDIFKKYTDEGYEVLYISISSCASGTFNNSQIAKNMVLEENPEAVIELVDSQRFAYIYAEAAKEAARLAEEGKEIGEIKQYVIDFMESYDVYVAAQSLTYLEKGGRINKTSLVMGNVLDIRPVLSIRKGLIESIGTIRGSKKIVAKLFKKIQEDCADQSNTSVIIVNCAMAEEAEEMKALIQENLNPKEVQIQKVGPTIATHIGPVIGVFFRTK